MALDPHAVRAQPDVRAQPGVCAVAISDDLLRGVFTHARACFPRECCGYLVGPRGGQSATAAVRCTNVDPHPETGYGIDGRELLDFARTFESASPARVLYHSHPNGRAYFSARDRELAGGYPVQHLVVGLDEHEVIEAALFADVDGDFIEVWRGA